MKCTFYVPYNNLGFFFLINFRFGQLTVEAHSSFSTESPSVAIKWVHTKLSKCISSILEAYIKCERV